ncbi:MAG: phosphatidylserine decarboxylase [Deltaproteobacteria bacterium]|nr:phosphatidylserine decarboxylase [Deltaproteobacteria bacterium]
MGVIMQHQYIDRESRRIQTEKLLGDAAIRFLYSGVREWTPWLFRRLISARASRILGDLSYSGMFSEKVADRLGLSTAWGIDLRECVDPPARLDTLQRIFERKIRYWECRPTPNDPHAVVSPADARMLYGSFCETSSLFIKGKFFDYEELFGVNKNNWLTAFHLGDFGIFRLTPDKYHYNHSPVAGKIIDFYQIPGLYHACNPNAVVSVATPYSKNKRVVTLIDTDVPEGTQVGLVAMIEVVALMIGDIVQCYSEQRYDNPSPIGTGMFIRRGTPKSLFRPGSSTVVLVFQKQRVRFADDISANMAHHGAESIFSRNFGQPLVESDVKVRSLIASRNGMRMAS